MEMDKELLDALNIQLNREFHSAYFYLAMAAYFERENLKGFAKWMRAQAKEEADHAMKFFDFINERNETVVLKPIEVPKQTWSSPLEVFKDAYEHEQKVSHYIHRLYELAQEKRDYPTQVFLHWFITEQVEEEDQTLQIVELLEKAGDNFAAILELDEQLGSRE
ncbi:MAG: ferritin [Chlorobi bacterium]|nr:ferritin [Chlorobiota bacterium]